MPCDLCTHSKINTLQETICRRYPPSGQPARFPTIERPTNIHYGEYKHSRETTQHLLRESE